MQRNQRVALLFAAFAASACGSGGGAVVCDDGTVCVGSNYCEGGTCVMPPDPAVCEGRPDGEPCAPSADSEPGDGECVGETCVPFICGDGVAEGNEICDGAIGSGSCVAAGFDFGTPACVDSCDGDDLERCGNLGWTDISPPDPGLENRALYAVGDEIWLGGNERGYYFDGTRWVADATLTASSLSGTSRQNLWGIFVVSRDPFRQVARRWDGTLWGPDEALPSDFAGDIYAVSEDEVYIVAGPTLFRRQAGAWVEELTVAAGSFLREIGTVGASLVVVGHDGGGGGAVLAVRSGTQWSTRTFAGYLGGGSPIGASADDFHLVLSGFGGSPEGGFYSYNHTLRVTANSSEVVTDIGGPLVKLGDAVLSLSPGTMTQLGGGSGQLGPRYLRSPGSVSILGGPANLIVDAVVVGNRVVAATQTGVHVYYGAGYLDFVDSADVAVTSISRTGATLTVVRSSGFQKTFETIADAFGDDPTRSSFSLGNLQNLPVHGIWALPQGGGFFLSDSSGTPFVYAYTAGGQLSNAISPLPLNVLRAIDGTDDGASALAVGDNGEVWSYNGAAWQAQTIPGAETVNLRAVASIGDGYVVGGDGGALFVRTAQGGWQALNSGSTANISAIDGSAVEFWAAGSGGAIIHCVDGTCVVEVVPGAPNIRDISVASPSDIFAVAGSVSYHYDGLRWSEFSNDRNITAVVANLGVVWMGNGVDSNFYLERLERSRSWIASP